MAKASFLERVANKVKRWLTGGSSKPKASAPKPRVRYNNPQARNQTVSSRTSNRGRVLIDVDDKKEEKRVADAFKAKTREAQDMTAAFKKQATPDPKIEAAKKSRAEMRKKLEAKKQERKEEKKSLSSLHEKTGHKYDVKSDKMNMGELLTNARIDPEARKQFVKHHPIQASTERGVANAVTGGAIDLAMKRGTKGKTKEAEEYYQAHKNKAAETAGEIAGSFAFFGGTAGMTDRLGEKVISKAAPRAAEKLAGTKLIQNAAKKSVTKAVEKGTVKSATKELVEQVGKDKAKKIVNAVGNDIVQNATTGLLYDFNKASTEYEVGSPEWWREMGKSAAFNAAITGAVGVGSAVSGNKQLVKGAAEKVVDRARARATLSPKRLNVEDLAPNVVSQPRPQNRIAPRIGESIEDRIARVNAERLGARADEAGEAIEKPLVNDFENIAEKPFANELENVERNGNNSQINLEDEVSAQVKEPDGNKQMTLDDAIKASEERKASQATVDTVAEEKKAPPKSKEQIEKEQQEDKKFFNSLNDMRKTTAEADESMRKQTGGEFGVRQGERTAAEHAPIDEAKRIKDETDAVNKALKDGNIKELFTDDSAPFSVFKTANREERARVASEATARVNEDAYKVASRLFEKAERLKESLLTNSTLTSGEHVTLDDVADIIALRNKASDNGYTMPAKYEEAFTHIIEWQRTEGAQMLKAVDLYLKENDSNYRRMLLSRDINNYLRKVLKLNSVGIEDVKRSFDLNNGAGSFEKMMDALAEFTGSENEAAFRKAYADFQAEIFMNTKPTVWDAVNLWRHTLMLSSPKTGANNIIGNVLQRTMYNISDALNAVGESIAQGINKDVKRTTAFLKTDDQRRLARMYTNGKRGEKNLKNAKYLEGFKDQDFANAINNVADADVGEMMASSKYMGEVVKGLKYKPTTAAGKVKQGINNLGGTISQKYVSTMLNEPDSWFVERNYRSALLKYLEANGVNSAETLAGNEKILKEARAYAKDVALENTYKKANNVVSFLEGIRRKGHTKGSNLGYKVGAIVLDAELPYLKVPANLVVNNFKYSPMGVFNVAADAYKYIVKGDVDALNKATRDLSKSLTGTGMAALGYMMFCRDQMDDDSWGFIGNAKDELKEYGVRDNSFKIGDHNFSIANMGIGSVQFLMGAALAEDLAEQGKTPPHQVVIDALGKTVDTVADMSLMENAVSLLDMFGNGGDYEATVSERLGNAAAEVAGDYAAQFIANPLRGVAKGMTDADLDTGVKKGDTSKVQRILERNKNNFVQGLPVINEKALPHKVDTHGNLVGERKTASEKAIAIANNTLNPLSPKKVKIPEADKIELSVKDEDGKAFKPKGFDPKREYKSDIGQGKYKETIDLTAKQREQVARAAKNSGFDMANALVKKGMFGDRLGDRAQSILKSIPDDEEKAREMIFSTKEWKNLSNEDKNKYLNIMYGQGGGTNNRMGVERTRKAEAYIGVAGNSEGDFRYQNDLNWQYQKKYEDNGFADMGIDKGTYADVIQSIYDSSHKWDDVNKKNIDTPNSARKVKAGILAIEGLSPEQRVAIYQAIRGKRNGFGWYDWDGVSAGGGYRRRGYGRRWRHYGHGGRGSKAKALKQSNFKATKRTYKDTAASLKTSSSRSKGLSSAASTVKVEPPKVKFKKYDV